MNVSLNLNPFNPEDQSSWPETHLIEDRDPDLPDEPDSYISDDCTILVRINGKLSFRCAFMWGPEGQWADEHENYDDVLGWIYEKDIRL